MIKIATPRFGTVQRSEDDLLLFPGGIQGFELHRQWLLLADREHGGLYWLQSAEEVDLNVAVVSPHEFVSEYALSVGPDQLASLGHPADGWVVLSVLTELRGGLQLNLRQPIIINRENRLGRQVTARHTVTDQVILPEQVLSLRKSA